MLAKNNQLYNLVLLLFTVSIGGIVLFLNPVLSDKGLASLGSYFVKDTTPAPVGIDLNFFKQVDECFFPIASLNGYTLRISSSFRTETDQDQLFSQGRTVNGHIVTWAEPGKSLHNYGFAIDVVDRWRGYDINWKKLAKIGIFCGLEQVDDPHFEHRAGLSTADFASGLRPVPLTLPCAVMDERAEASQPLTAEDLKNCNVPKF